MSMRTQMVKTASTCFAVKRNIRSIRRSVTQRILESLVVLPVLSRLDYGGATLAGLLVRMLDRLQSVQDTAVRLIYSARLYKSTLVTCARKYLLQAVGTCPPLRAPFGTGLFDDGAAVRIERSYSSETRFGGNHFAGRASHQTSKHVTIGDRSLPVAAALAWNSIPEANRSSSSLPVFCKLMKIFRRSYCTAD
jgi:hypothetical protein